MCVTDGGTQCGVIPPRTTLPLFPSARTQPAAPAGSWKDVYEASARQSPLKCRWLQLTGHVEGQMLPAWHRTATHCHTVPARLLD